MGICGRGGIYLPKKSLNLNMYHQKQGMVMTYLVNYFMETNVGDRIETIEEISSKLGVGRGTVQTVFMRLKDQQIIQTESRGHLGTCLINVDYDKLLRCAGVQEILGVMPILRSKKLEGLAAGIRTSLSQVEGIRAELSYVHGAQQRLNALLEERYDFAVMSHQAAKKHLKEHPTAIIIVKVIGKESYIGRHVLVTRKDFPCDGSRIIRVGVDFSSDDQAIMTMRYFANKKIIVTPCQSDGLAQAIMCGLIDCGIDNSDSSYLDFDEICTMDIVGQDENRENTETAIVVRSNDHIMQRLLTRNLDIALIEKIQQEVM